MAASAGSMKFVGKNRTYTIDMYIPDAVATDITFSAAGLAASTSQPTWRAPENVVMTEVSLSAAAPTAVGAFLTVNNAVVNGGTWKHANQLSTLATRMSFYVPIKAGDFVGARQF